MKKFITFVIFMLLLTSCASFKTWILEPNNLNEAKDIVAKYLTMQSKEFTVAPSYTIVWDAYSTNALKEHMVGVFIGNSEEMVHFVCDAVKAYKAISKQEVYSFGEVCSPLTKWKMETLPNIPKNVAGEFWDEDKTVALRCLNSEHKLQCLN